MIGLLRRPALLPLTLAIAGIGIMLAGGWLAVEDTSFSSSRDGSC